jgi:hypothetical protein
MTIPRLYVPLIEPEDVVRHLGRQEKHWKEKKSAHALATLWSQSTGLPTKIEAALKTRFESPQLIDAFLERQTDLQSEGRPSQTDLLAVVGIGKDDLVIVAVEGKAGEPFGKRVEEWLKDGGKKDARLTALCETLELSRDSALPLRYQLLHRSASAILEARRYRTTVAVLLVHSFNDDKKGIADFDAFLKALRFEEPTRNALTGPVELGGVSLYAGWVQDDAPENKNPNAYLDALDSYAANLAKECKRVREWCDKRRSKL